LGENATPDRIAANIVTGVGFLGAGVIFRSENRVNGITTAATIWTVAAVGMAIGAGHYFASAVGSILILIVLGILTIGERFIENFNSTKTYSIECVFASDVKKKYQELFTSSQLKFKLIKEIKEGKRLVLVWAAIGRAKDHEKLLSVLNEDDNISRLETY
jgi:putative Mg2+ transporter-C (MgtC) family protein